MNETIIKIAVKNVKKMVSPVDDLCELCRKNKSEIPPTFEIEIKGIMTEIGVYSCKSCLDNIRIEVGILSDEY